jgi:hypothetical protein
MQNGAKRTATGWHRHIANEHWLETDATTASSNIQTGPVALPITPATPGRSIASKFGSLERASRLPARPE